ncbi:MAG: hypothetical protein ACRDZ3_13335 [Acidimicrobiia bacterium]
MDTRCLHLGRLALAVVAVLALAAPAGAQSPQPQVKIERGERTGQTPLWLPVRVTVTEAGGAPFSVDHLVFVIARDVRGEEAGPFELGTLELESPSGRGVHEGFVIVPYGGTWTITATVNEAAAGSEGPAALLGRGSADLVVDAPVPPVGTATADSAGTTRASEPVKVAVLWLHNLAAILWGSAIALLALLALPGGRRFLSESGTTILDGRLDKIVRTAWWLTGLVVATGTYNLVNSVAYRVPLSPEQATRLFRLPYAQPYYLSLTVKLLAYAVMIGATVPLIREARRRAASAGAGTGNGAARTVGLDDDPSPWENPQTRSETGGSRVVLRRRSAAQAAVEADWAPDGQSGPARGLVTLMVAGAAVIITAVTLLKYFHLLGEVSRLSG